MIIVKRPRCFYLYVSRSEADRLVKQENFWPVRYYNFKRKAHPGEIGALRGRWGMYTYLMLDSEQ